MSEKQDHEKKFQARLDQWNAEIDKLAAQAKVAQQHTRLEYIRQLENLTAMQKDAEEKLAELKEANEDAWEDLKTGTENAVASMDSAVKMAIARFR